MGNAAVLQEPDYGRDTQCKTSGMQKVTILLFSHRYALQHQYDSAACGTNIDWFVRSVQNQYRLMKGVTIATQMHSGCEQSSRQGPASTAERRVVSLQ